MPYPGASAIDIDRKLREDFRRRVKEYGVPTDVIDPVLAVVFRSFAQLLEALYADTGRIRLSLLDELIDGLSIERRSARPAQTVIRFLSDSLRCIEAGSELLGEAQSGERLTFRTDVLVNVSPARLAMVAVYEAGFLQLTGSNELSERFQNARPALDPVRANLGSVPAIYLVFENLTDEHLGRHSIFFDLGPDARAIQDALEREPWCLGASDGTFSSAGILCPAPLNAGVRGLQWLTHRAPLARTESGNAAADDSKIPFLPPGFYGPRTFVLPVIPEQPRFLCAMPRRMEPAMQKIFGRDMAALFAEPRAWVRIGLPGSVTGVHRALGTISLHAITASNAELINQTIYFDRHGTSIPISREAGTNTALVSPLSIVGEFGTPYIREMQASSDANAGRYAIRNGRLELCPGQAKDGRPERHANVRVWVTGGGLGNRVGPGQVQSFVNKAGWIGVRVINPTSAAGGTDGETFDQAHARFSEVLLSRDRIVTRNDLANAVYAFDRRILDVRVAGAFERSQSGLQRVQRVTVALDREDFIDPDIEARFLLEDLAGMLRSRTLLDIETRVDMEWK